MEKSKRFFSLLPTHKTELEPIILPTCAENYGKFRRQNSGQNKHKYTNRVLDLNRLVLYRFERPPK